MLFGVIGEWYYSLLLVSCIMVMWVGNVRWLLGMVMLIIGLFINYRLVVIGLRMFSGW